MLILALADRPDIKSYGIVPFIVRTGDGRNLVCGHPERELDDERLRSLLANPIGALDVSSLGARIDAYDPDLMACWIGGAFEAERLRLGVPSPERDLGAHVLEGQASFWIAPAAALHEGRQRWLMRAARIAVRRGEPDIAALMRWADPFAFVTHAVSWATSPSEEGKRRELARSASYRFRDRGKVPRWKLAWSFRRIVKELRRDAPPA